MGKRLEELVLGRGLGKGVGEGIAEGGWGRVWGRDWGRGLGKGLGKRFGKGLGEGGLGRGWGSFIECDRVLIDARRSACGIPWPCVKCSLMPWRCRCRSLVSSVQSESDSDAEFERISKRAGVWATASEHQRAASALAAREQSPEPDREEAIWACPACHSMNTCDNTPWNPGAPQIKPGATPL